MPLILPNTLANLIPADGDKLGQNFATIQDYVNQETVNRQGTVAMTGPLLLPGVPTQANQAATKGYVDSQGGIVGEVKMFGGDTEPAGWMFCRGQAVSRATYAALFAVIGTKFGAGDGSTTFALPNFQGTAPVGHNTQTNPPAGIGTVFTVGVGERGGSATPTSPAHSHGLNVWSGANDVSHIHAVSITSSGQSANHYHGPPSGSTGYWVSNTGGSYAAGNSSPIKFISAGGTDWATNDHSHGVTGNTGGADRTHRHAINGNTDSGGAVGSQTSGNYPPSLAVNFIMKVA